MTQPTSQQPETNIAAEPAKETLTVPSSRSSALRVVSTECLLRASAQGAPFIPLHVKSHDPLHQDTDTNGR